MNCPKCGYAMTDFDTECPRCKVLGRQPQAAPAAAPPPAPLPAVQPAPAKAEAKSKEAPVIVAVPPRSSALTWGLIAVGVVVAVLLAALLWTQLRKPTGAGQLAQRPAEAQTPAQTGSENLAAGPQANQQAATTNQEGLAQSQGKNVAPATGGEGLAQAENKNVPPATGGPPLAQGQQQNVPPATTGAGNLAEDEEQPWDANSVRPVGKVYQVTFSGMFTTPQISVHRPWWIEYYTGVRPDNEMALDTFAIFPGTGSLQTPVISTSQPNFHGTMPCYKRGPVTLQIVTMFNNWSIIVWQGEFKPGAR
jgi:hypothetical protein